MTNDKKDLETKVNKISFNKMRIVSYGSALVVFAFVIIFSLIPVGLDFTRIFSSVWWTNMLILVFLSIYGLPYGESEGGNYFRTRVDGAFQIARNKFLDTVERIARDKRTSLLPKWLQHFFKKKRTLYYQNLMLKHEIKNFEVVDLTKDELDLLTQRFIKKEINGKEIYFDILTEEQLEVVMAIKNGNVQVSTIDDYNYYITEIGDASSRDIERQALDADKQKMNNRIFRYGTRLITLFAFAMIFAGIFVDGAAGSGPQTWFNLFSRLSCLMAAIVGGINTARMNTNIDIFVFKYKEDRLNLFEQELEAKLYYPVDEIEIVKQKYAEQERKELEKLEKEKAKQEPEIVVEKPKTDVLSEAIVESEMVETVKAEE